MTTTPAAATVHVVGSASISVLSQVAGPRRTASVLHAGRSAAYVDLDGSCLAVLAARAAQVPCGVRTLLPALPELLVGDVAVVQDGSIEVGGCEVMVTGIVDTTVPVLHPAAAARASECLARLGERVTHVRRLLPTDAQESLRAGDAAAVTDLLGRGPGLTPLGDDVLAGWLAAAVAARHPALEDVRRTVALHATPRTTTLSATLLACASRGEALPELRNLLCGLAGDDDAAVERSADRLAAVGETSGAGLLLGALLALEGNR